MAAQRVAEAFSPAFAVGVLGCLMHVWAIGPRTPSRLRGHADRLRADVDALVEPLLEDAGRSPASSHRERLVMRLGKLPRAAAFARHRLRSWLCELGVDEHETADLALALSEACANAIEHPVRPRRQLIDVEAMCNDDEIRIAVRDFGRWNPAAGDPSRGRGLTLIRKLMDATEIERAEDGTRIVMTRARRRTS
jgi:anti-sigma regulatory factor (Ser/Thr protein kinase)